MRFTRRHVLDAAAMLGGASLLWSAPGRAEDAGTSAGELATHGLSSFGELAMPADFAHFAYVEPNAPKGGTLTLQIQNTSGNQNFETFDTFNIFVFKGDGAAGVDATFDTLMAGSADEPNALYGLVARAVRISPDRLTYRFLLRPEARFHDGSRLTAHDVAASLDLLKSKGHPIYRLILAEFESATAESDDVCRIVLSPNRSRDLHLVVAGLPIFSKAYYANHEFDAATLEPPLGSGPYKVGRFEQGRYVEYDRIADYWGANLPVNIGTNNFDHIRWEYYRERQVAFEDFKAGKLNYREEFTARIWATQYDFPALSEGRVKREELPSGAAVPVQGWHFNLRRPQFKDPRVREALNCCFDFEWTNKNIMYSAYARLHSYFQNSPMQARGAPDAAVLALLEPFRDRLAPDAFGEPWSPPTSDGSGADRALLRRADELLRLAGCKRDGSQLRLPDGQVFTIEFLDSSSVLQPHTDPFIANLRRLGIDARLRVVDTVQYKRRIDAFDFDMTTSAMGGSTTPGVELMNVYGSKAAQTPGSRNLSGVADPVVDALLDVIAKAQTRETLDAAARALDRVLRSGRYWVPMWYSGKARLAYWDVFLRPATTPKFGTGAPGTWWWDEAKARKIGYQG